MSNIRNLLNRYALKDNQLQNISCTLAREKNTSIIKREKEKEIGLFSDKFQNYENLHDIIEMELRTNTDENL